MNTLNPAHRSSTWLVALTAVSCTLGAGRAFAAPETEEVRSVTVSYADLNLSTVAGARSLYHRIQGAARTVCPQEGVRDLGRYYGWKRCYEGAIANAVAKVNSPLLTEVHGSKTGEPKVALLSQSSGTK
jgi:UrcA family protein